MKNIVLTVSLFLYALGANSQSFTLGSSDLGGQFTNTFMAGNFGCNGSNVSPELHWNNAPAGTKSFAITLYDFDAPTGSGFWHWVVVDLPPSVQQLKRGAANASNPVGLATMNDAGTTGYQGPCPDEGTAPHRYLFTVYALNTVKLGTDSKATAALTGYLLNKAAIAKASLLVYCKR